MSYFKQSILLLGLIISGISASATSLPRFSSAGFYPLENSGRQVSNFNVGWRFHIGSIPQAETIDFNDSQWPVVSLPHSVQLVPAAATDHVIIKVKHGIASTSQYPSQHSHTKPLSILKESWVKASFTSMVN